MHTLQRTLRAATRLLVLGGFCLAIACETTPGSPDAADTPSAPDAAPDAALADVPAPADTPAGTDLPGPADVPPPDDAQPPPDAPGAEDVALPADVSPPACEGAAEEECLARAGCLLELAPDGGYRCRAAANACERIADATVCAATPGCAFHPGYCYCPPDHACACGGGPPMSCRAADDLGPCRAEAALFDCPDGYECCGATEAVLGACRPTGACDAPDACAPLLTVRTEGGLCQHGACFRELRVGVGGYLFADDETPWTPRDDTLGAAWAAELDALLAAVDVAALAPGYGECCNSAFDGSDVYVTFHGTTERTTRISDGTLAPAALRALVAAVEAAGAPLLADTRDNPAAFAACPGLSDVPTGDGPPPSTCENAFDLAGANFVWAIDGPNGQHLDRDRIALDGVDPTALPVTLTREGLVTAVTSDGGLTLVGADGEWRLSFEGREASVPTPCVVVGQRVRLTARVAWAFDLNIHGLMLSDERGVLFATDEGLSGVHTAAESPFAVATASELCPPVLDEGLCGPRGAQELVFTAGADRLVLRTGEWGRLRVGGGYDLAVRNLRSFQTGYCDDNWNYAYVALAIAGSDRALCGDPGPPGCRGNDCPEAEYCRRPGEPMPCGTCFRPEPSCELDTDCSDGMVCELVDGPCACEPALACIPACTDATACAEGFTCGDAGRCVPLLCLTDAECPPQFLCPTEGAGGSPACRRRTCRADTDCPDGYCVLGACYGTLGTCTGMVP